MAIADVKEREFDLRIILFPSQCALYSVCNADKASNVAHLAVALQWGDREIPLFQLPDVRPVSPVYKQDPPKSMPPKPQPQQQPQSQSQFQPLSQSGLRPYVPQNAKSNANLAPLGGNRWDAPSERRETPSFGDSSSFDRQNLPPTNPRPSGIPNKPSQLPVPHVVHQMPQDPRRNPYIQDPIRASTLPAPVLSQPPSSFESRSSGYSSDHSTLNGLPFNPSQDRDREPGFNSDLIPLLKHHILEAQQANRTGQSQPYGGPWK
jgi:hypothetical protein